MMLMTAVGFSFCSSVFLAQAIAGNFEVYEVMLRICFDVR